MKSRGMIYICSCLMIICVLLCVYMIRQEPADEKPVVPLYATVEDNKGEECIISAYTQDENTYFFLPSYTDMSRVKLHTQEKVYINNNSVTDDAVADKYQLNKPYKLTVNNKDNGNIIFVRSSAVATMYIDTATKSMENIYNDIDYKELAKVRLINDRGEVEYTGENDELSGRGNSTWLWDQLGKKPFSLKLHYPHELLGMEAERKWALLANAKDRTNIKNKMVCDFAAEMGMCAPRSEYVDLYLNGEYNGLYQLSEKTDCIKRTGFKENSSDFLFLRDSFIAKYKNHFKTNDDQPIAVKQPEFCSDEMMDNLKKHVQSMENAILSESGIDDATGKRWTDLIDMDSWVKKYLLEEVFMNVDGGFNSQFFYWMPESDDKIYAGPAWDYDIVLGSLTAKLFTLGQDTLVDDRNRTSWYIGLYKKKEFYNALVEEYKKEFLPKLERLRDKDIDAMADNLKEASYMNGLRWQDMYSFKSETDALNRLKDRLSGHIEFLNSAWINGTEYCTVKFKRENATTMYAPFSVEKGKPFDDMPENSALAVDENTIWYDERSGEVYDPSVPVTEDIVLCTRNAEKVENTPPPKSYSITDKIKTRFLALFYLIPAGVLGIVLIILFVIDTRRNNIGGIQDE